MSFEPGDEVVVVDGEMKGRYGVVQSYEEIFEIYRVSVPEVSQEGDFGFSEDEIAKLEELEEVEDEEPVPPFGMTANELAAYAGDFIEGSLDRILTVGDAKYGQQGYQEFEATQWEEILVRILDDTRDIAAHAAMLHILVRRMLVAAKGS